ncbi:hypothetical protein GCM10011371_19640 [Novosphingobium marinum]|uniref:Uncharacterized protein n=1 Tax=Novosphingobium marinum TaxID=1514948 RepID=A0A7Y9XWX9_9SPHN|nr:hypothetical protein [Novosphingobium marinum]NYH96077.1 hypothetical protein [Novosphingobium marinum]GGC32278.1 hypothetical protein GCM10011371_19640 [Novosphingobium marinum]
MAETKTWKRSAWTDAGQLVELIDPDSPTREAVGKTLPAWYSGLVDSGDLTGACNFLAHALPRYECIAWAAQALLEIGAVDRKDPLMVASLRWLDDPDDARRRAANDAAQQVRPDTPAKLLAMAIFFSGGSIAPADLAPVQPAPDVCAKLAGAAVLVGGYAQPDPDTALRKVLALGEMMAKE